MSKNLETNTNANEVFKIAAINDLLESKKSFSLVKLGTSLDDIVLHIDNQLSNISESFFNLGKYLFQLKEIWDEGFTKKEFYKYCKERFNLSKSSICNFISVYETFKNPDGYSIASKYKGIAFSKLVELLRLPDKDVPGAIKLLSTSKIRKYVDFCKELKSEDIVTNSLLKFFTFIKLVLESENIVVIKNKIVNDSFNPYLQFKFFDRTARVSLNVRGYKHLGSNEYLYDVSIDYKECKGFSELSSPYFYIDFNDKSDIDTQFESFFKWMCAYRDYRNSPREAMEEDKHKLNKFVPSGSVKRLGLKKSELIPFVDDPANYNQGNNKESKGIEFDASKDIKINLGGRTLFIRPLDGCPFIFGVFYKKTPDDLDWEYLSEEERKQDNFVIVNNKLSVLNKWDKEKLMMQD